MGRGLYTHLHWDTRMRIVTFYDEVLADKIVNILNLSFPTKLWERPRLAFKLQAKRVFVVAVDMCVPELDDKFVGICVGDMGDHVRE